MKTWLLLPTECERIRALEAFIFTQPAQEMKITSSAIPMDLSYGTATIHVTGTLVKERDTLLDFFGIKQTAYSEIKSQIYEAVERGAKRGVMMIDSPGGEVTGLADTMDTIASSPIDWKAVSGDVLASAAYMIASQCKGGIFATSDTDMIGSIGVATSAMVSADIKHIANTDSAKKRPDLTTEEGVASVREELDDIYGILVGKIAKGRNTTVASINENYGQGAVMTALTAKRKGIIDGIEKPPKPAAKNAAVGGEKMTLEELKAQHPEAHKAAYEEGKTAEQHRVKQHCELAKMHDTASIAIDDILAGKDADFMAYARHKDFSEKAKAMKDRAAEAIPSIPGSSKPATGLGGNENAATVKAELAAKHPTIKIVEVRG
jgi:ClpP class serine protease